MHKPRAYCQGQRDVRDYRRTSEISVQSGSYFIGLSLVKKYHGIYTMKYEPDWTLISKVCLLLLTSLGDPGNMLAVTGIWVIEQVNNNRSCC